MRKLFCIAAIAGLVVSAEAAPTGTVAGSVVVKKNGKPKGDRGKVVVYLENVAPPLAGKGAQIRQRNQQFDPELTVVPRGTTVEFPNEDKIFHNVFSLSEPATFDLGLYKSGTSKSVTLKEAGVVDVYCNIHPDMVAKIRVVESNFYAVTGADGSFRIENVPAGSYPIVAWQMWGEPWRGQVTVNAGGTATLSIELVEGERSTRHLRKDNTPYGRYK